MRLPVLRLLIVSGVQKLTETSMAQLIEHPLSTVAGPVSERSRVGVPVKATNRETCMSTSSELRGCHLRPSVHDARLPIDSKRSSVTARQPHLLPRRARAVTTSNVRATVPPGMTAIHAATVHLPTSTPQSRLPPATSVSDYELSSGQHWQHNLSALVF